MIDWSHSEQVELKKEVVEFCACAAFLVSEQHLWKNARVRSLTWYVSMPSILAVVKQKFRVRVSLHVWDHEVLLELQFPSWEVQPYFE